MDTPRDGRGGGESIGDSVWIRGVDYVAGWREANTVASHFEAAARELGFDPEDGRFRALPRTGPDGEPLVLLTAEGVQLCVAVLVVLAEFL